MKTLLFKLNFALYLCLLPFTAYAGTEVVAPTPPTNLTDLENFGQTILHSTGLAVGVYPSVMLGTLPAGSKATDRYGAGGIIVYPVSEFAWVGLRLNYISGSFWAPSATLGARYTLKDLPMKPTFFTTGGLVYAVSGAGVDTHSVGAIAGLGVIGNIKTSKDGRYSLDAFIEGEKWTNLPGEVINFGLSGGVKLGRLSKVNP